jgi:hypothetical protein
MSKITYQPIGLIHSPHKDPKGTPLMNVKPLRGQIRRAHFRSPRTVRLECGTASRENR